MGNIDALENFRPDSSLLEINRATCGTRRPYIDVGEFLPPLAENEIEFARINLASTTGDVFSFRIKKKGNVYYVTIVDEYETEFVDYKSIYDLIPTQGEILDLITEMNNEKDSQPYWLAIIEQNGFESIKQITDFIHFDSNVYPNLKELFIYYLVENGISGEADIVEDEIDKEKLAIFADLIKNQNTRSDWDSLMGTICFNIWHNTNQSFLKFQDLEYINISFLFALNLFQKWDKIYLSKKYDLGFISKDASPFVINMSSKLLDDVTKLKEFIGLMKEAKSNLTAIHFISIFAGELMNTSEFNQGNINPLDYFQQGVEILCLFTHKLKDQDKAFFNELLIIDNFEEKIEDIIQQINSLQDTEN